MDMGPLYARLSSREKGKCITAGQRAGERAVRRLYRPYEFAEDGARVPPPEVLALVGPAASAASAAARDRYARKVLGVKAPA